MQLFKNVRASPKSSETILIYVIYCAIKLKSYALYRSNTCRTILDSGSRWISGVVYSER